MLPLISKKAVYVPVRWVILPELDYVFFGDCLNGKFGVTWGVRRVCGTVVTWQKRREELEGRRR
jgi:hypothetical protein